MNIFSSSFHFFFNSQEVKDKYPIGYDLEVVDNVMFIKSIGRARDERPCTDPDVAMAMRAKGYDMVEKRPWMVLDKEVCRTGVQPFEVARVP